MSQETLKSVVVGCIPRNVVVCPKTAAPKKMGLDGTFSLRFKANQAKYSEAYQLHHIFFSYLYPSNKPLSIADIIEMYRSPLVTIK